MRKPARGWILLLTLFAFAHVAIGLAYKDLWWDESLSLQRAEEGLWNLLRGVLVIQDGFTRAPTIDQHPFFSFLLQAGVVQVAGNSEYALRFVSAAAATLMAPVLWVFAQMLGRKEIAPQRTAQVAAILAAASPFLLWYGQEARPYALWAMLAMLSTYLLVTALESRSDARWRVVAYGITLALFLATHYYAAFLLPVHALILIVRYWSSNRRLVVAVTALFLLIGVALVGYAYWNVVSQGGGGNFPSVTLGILLPDLLNAFTFGLSVNIDQVRWLNAVAGLLAILGAAWMLRSRRSIGSGGWIVPLCLLTPVGLLLVGNLFQNLYMNARHMSLIAGPLLLLVATGITVVWLRWRWVGAALLVLLLSGFAYSTVNYYTQEEYAKDDYSRLGAYMDGRIMSGDAVLYYPSSSWRIFEYYVPRLAEQTMGEEKDGILVYGIPLLTDDANVDPDFTNTTEFLTELGARVRRIWVLKSGTHPYYDLDGTIESWLTEHFLKVRDAQFFSHSSLRAQLYLPEVPVTEGDPGTLPNATQVEFGDNIRLAGYLLEPSANPALPLPATLYWQVNEKPEQRYKFVLELLRQTTVDGVTSLETLSTVEREPYEGDIPTTFWDPDRTIAEFVELPGAAVDSGLDEFMLALQIYDADTLEKLPVTEAAGFETDAEGSRVLLPLDDEAGRTAQ